MQDTLYYGLPQHLSCLHQNLLWILQIGWEQSDHFDLGDVVLKKKIKVQTSLIINKLNTDKRTAVIEPLVLAAVVVCG